MEDKEEIKRAAQSFFGYLLQMQRSFQDIVSTSKSDEELMYRLAERTEKHKWHSFKCQCKNLVRWRSEKKSASV